MSFRPSSHKALRLLPRKSLQQQCLLHPNRRFQPHTTSLRSIFSEPPPPPRNPVDPITVHRAETARRAYYARRSRFLIAGAIFGMFGVFVTATMISVDPRHGSGAGGGINKLDSGKGKDGEDDPLVVLGRERRVIVQKLGQEPEERVDVVQTGTSSVPTFPRVIDFADNVEEIEKLQHDKNQVHNVPGGPTDSALTEYQLLGLGIRTVSFLGIQVYVVGVYIATEDIAKIQQKLVRRITANGSTLVAGEKEKLKAMLLDPEQGLDIWDDILQTAGVRSCVRIVPVRNTDFHHMRDAWVRLVTAKAQSNQAEYGDEQFGLAVSHFKQLFTKGSIPKGREILLNRNAQGKLAIWYDDGKNGAQRLGEVTDERIGRAVWLNYLAGKTVASESARKSTVEGLIEFVERPIGTVATKIDLHV